VGKNKIGAAYNIPGRTAEGTRGKGGFGKVALKREDWAQNGNQDKKNTQKTPTKTVFFKTWVNSDIVQTKKELWERKLTKKRNRPRTRQLRAEACSERRVDLKNKLERLNILGGTPAYDLGLRLRPKGKRAGSKGSGSGLGSKGSAFPGYCNETCTEEPFPAFIQLGLLGREEKSILARGPRTNQGLLGLNCSLQETGGFLL